MPVMAVALSPADPVSLPTAATFNAVGGKYVVVPDPEVEKLGRSGAGVGASGGYDATGHAAVASSYWVAVG
jgi:hypothetical protein